MSTKRIALCKKLTGEFKDADIKDENSFIKISQRVRRRMFEQEDRQYVSDVVVVGKQSDGKSTLCNSLMKNIVLPMGTGLCTRVRVRVSVEYHESAGGTLCTLKRKDSSNQLLHEGDLQAAFEKLQEINQQDDGRIKNSIYELTLRSHKPIYSMAIIDNPGLNERSREMAIQLSNNSIDEYFRKGSTFASLVVCTSLVEDVESQFPYSLNLDNIKCVPYFVFTKMDIFPKSSGDTDEKVKSMAQHHIKITSNYEDGGEHSIVDIINTGAKRIALEILKKGENESTDFLDSHIHYVASCNSSLDTSTTFDMGKYISKFQNSEKERNEEMLAQLESYGGKEYSLRTENGIKTLKIKRETIDQIRMRNEIGIDKLYYKLIESTRSSLYKSMQNFKNTIKTDVEALKVQSENAQKSYNTTLHKGERVCSFIDDFSNSYSTLMLPGTTAANEISKTIKGKINHDHGCNLEKEHKMFSHICDIGRKYECSKFSSNIATGKKVMHSVHALASRFKYHYTTSILSIDKGENRIKLDDIMPEPAGGFGNLDANQHIINLSVEKCKEIIHDNADMCSSRLGLYFAIYSEVLYNAFLETGKYADILQEGYNDAITHGIIGITKNAPVERPMTRNYSAETSEVSTNRSNDVVYRDSTNDLCTIITAYSYLYNAKLVKEKLNNQWNPSCEKPDKFNVLMVDYGGVFIHQDKTYHKSSEKSIHLLLEQRNPNSASGTGAASSAGQAPNAEPSTTRPLSDPVPNTARTAPNAGQSTTRSTPNAMPSTNHSAYDAGSGAARQGDKQYTIVDNQVKFLNRKNKVTLIDGNSVDKALMALLSTQTHTDVIPILNNEICISNEELDHCRYLYSRLVSTSVYSMMVSTMGIIRNYVYDFHGRDHVNLQLTSRLSSLLLGYDHPYSSHERPNDYRNPMNAIPFLYVYREYLESKTEMTCLKSDLPFTNTPLFNGLCNMRQQGDNVCAIISDLYSIWTDVCNNGDDRWRWEYKLERYIVNKLSNVLYPKTMSEQRYREQVEKSRNDIDALEGCIGVVNKLLRYMEGTSAGI